ncbi:ribosomal-protein-alanine N-acetyltransferase, partial [Cutibacterium acnes subsp. acnes]|nr:ribosomal-protein-alanine N-acetyltransferase [Cutibacterium acnes subsp. acnes]
MTRPARMADLDAVMAVEQASFDPAWSRASWAEGIAPADHRLT